MNIFIRIGNFVEKHWPSKMTTQEVMDTFSNYESRQQASSNQIEAMGIQLTHLEITHADLNNRLHIAESSATKMREELGVLKNQSTVKSRLVVSTPDTMTPFASRLPPLHPANANGGNRSPQ